MIYIICRSSLKFSDFYHTFAWLFPLINTFQHQINHRAWSFWPGLRFDTSVWLLRLDLLLLFSGFVFIWFIWLSLAHVCKLFLWFVAVASHTIAIEFHIILMIAFSNINCFSKFNLRTFLIVYKKTDEWYIEWQRVVQRVTTNDNEWQRVTISANFSFFQIREEPTTKHSKENSLKRTFEEGLLN